MTVATHLCGRIGIELASRLGLQLDRREGHDLAGRCIACESSDAFRLHQERGVAQCYSCGGKWSPFQLVEAVLGNRERAAMLVELGLFHSNGKGNAPDTDPIEVIARRKGITPESLRAFGAQKVSGNAIRLPAYGPDGKQCTSFTMTVRESKGMFAKGKKAGLFFPPVDGKVRLPQPGEVWHVVEGPKDAAALHGLGLLACGTNTCRLAAKFARLFAGVEVILISDRDRAGEEGGEHSARILRGVAKSVRIAVLPAEFKESGGDDVRDVLRRKDGRELVLQAIADARPPDGWDGIKQDAGRSVASAEIPLPEGEPLELTVGPTNREQRRLVVATCGDVEHRDRINTDSSISLDRCLIVWLPEIPDENRQSEAALFEAFYKVRPKILGALLDAVAVGLRRLPSIELPTLPRMADFAVWATAAETGFGWPEGTFMAAYHGNRECANEVALEASVVGPPLLALLEAKGEWVGSSGELLAALEGSVGEQTRRQKSWPKNGRSLSGHVKRLAPNLRKVGWAIEQDRSSKKRLWLIRVLPMTQAQRANLNRHVLRHAATAAKRCGPMQARASQPAMTQMTRMTQIPEIVGKTIPTPMLGARSDGW